MTSETSYLFLNTQLHFDPLRVRLRPDEPSVHQTNLSPSVNNPLITCHQASTIHSSSDRLTPDKLDIHQTNLSPSVNNPLICHHMNLSLISETTSPTSQTSACWSLVSGSWFSGSEVTHQLVEAFDLLQADREKLTGLERSLDPERWRLQVPTAPTTGQKIYSPGNYGG